MRFAALPAIFASLFALSAVRAGEIPFRFDDGFIAIEARVAGSPTPLNLLLDSGAGASLLSLGTAERLGLPLGEPLTILGVGSEAVAYRLRDCRPTAGGIPLGPMTLTTDLSMADAICDRPVDGLIGIDFFKDRVVEIDYARRCLRILESAPAEPPLERLPIELRNGIICVPLSVNGSRPRLTRLDTGCNDAVHWVVPRRSARPASRRVSVGFATDPRDLVLTRVGLGGRTLSHVQTAIHARPLFPGEAGLLGNGVLSRFAVTIDWRNREVLLHDCAK